jgi:hypothetical protein
MVLQRRADFQSLDFGFLAASYGAARQHLAELESQVVATDGRADSGQPQSAKFAAC